MLLTCAERTAYIQLTIRTDMEWTSVLPLLAARPDGGGDFSRPGCG